MKKALIEALANVIVTRLATPGSEVPVSELELDGDVAETIGPITNLELWKARQLALTRNGLCTKVRKRIVYRVDGGHRLDVVSNGISKARRSIKRALVTAETTPISTLTASEQRRRERQIEASQRQLRPASAGPTEDVTRIANEVVQRMRAERLAEHEARTGALPLKT